MAQYTINWSSNDAPTHPDEGVPGKAPILLPEKTLNTSATSLTLTGKGVSNYGEIQQENFIRLMEHFASATPPAHGTVGQIWYNTSECILYIRVDPNSAAQMYPRYFPESPAAWAQIWPVSQAYASWQEYNALAMTINRIIGSPSQFGTATDIADRQYGWGQTDLVPEFIDAATPVPGTYDRPFDNTVWALFISRLRKALRHVGLPETLPSPVGFVNDGRPAQNDVYTTLANSYNNYPAVGTLPDIVPGWGGYGQLTLQTFWMNTVNATTQLEQNRFKAAPVSSSVGTLATATYNTPWSTSIQHSLDVTFTSESAAQAYFNSGGTIKFEMSLVPSIVNSINTSWQTFLANQTADLQFDLKGTRKNTVYRVPTGGTQTVGFYDLTGTDQVIYQAARESSPYGYDTITDGGLRILARKETMVSGEVVIHFNIQFIEGLNAGETVQGTLTSRGVSVKASNVNVNSPTIPFPTAVVSGFTPGPAPDGGLNPPGSFSVTTNPSSLSQSITGAGTPSMPISANVSGGTGPFTYAWSNVVGTATISAPTSATTDISKSLASGESQSGTVSVTVTDSTNATASAQANWTYVSNTNANALNVSTSPTSLTGNRVGPGSVSALIQATAAGGVPPYTYAWSNVVGTATFTSPNSASTNVSQTLVDGGSSTGTVRVTVTDAATSTVSKDITYSYSSTAQQYGVNAIYRSNTPSAYGGYTLQSAVPTVGIAGGGGSGASATAVFSSGTRLLGAKFDGVVTTSSPLNFTATDVAGASQGQVSSSVPVVPWRFSILPSTITVNAGIGYTTPPDIDFVVLPNSRITNVIPATGVATIVNGQIAYVTITNPGLWVGTDPMNPPPSSIFGNQKVGMTITGGDGNFIGSTPIVALSSDQFIASPGMFAFPPSVTAQSFGSAAEPVITIDNLVSGAASNVVVGKYVDSITVTNPGSGYNQNTPPSVTISGGTASEITPDNSWVAYVAPV